MRNNPATPLGQTTGPNVPLPGTQLEYGYRTAAGMGVTPGRLNMAAIVGTGLSGIVHLTFFRACKTMPANRFDMANTVAAGATPTLIKGALFAVDPLYNLTQIAVSANDTTLLNGTNAKYGKVFSTPVNLNYNSLYAFGFIWISAAAVPSILGYVAINGVTQHQYSSDPRVCATMIGAQTDMPVAITVAQLNAANQFLWAELS